jgi:predicted amidohydrolase YtcJ
VGKVADFAVLNLNPLAIDPLDLDKLTVLTTIKGGKVVFGSLPESANIDEMR